MIIKAEQQDYEEILSYIGNKHYKCIYLYLDLKQYGFDNDNVKCWIQRNNKDIIAVILMYYTGMHIFSNGNYEIKEIASLIKEENPTIICAEKNIVEELAEEVKEEYIEEYGWVRGLSEIEFECDKEVTTASKEDFKQIAKLLYEDENIGSSYELESLEKQMIERNEQKFVRNYVIKNYKGDVISHAGTGAEDEKLAMLNYVITHPEYRNKGLAKRVCNVICAELINEGKNVYLINYSNESTKLYDKIGFKICCEWGKLYKDLKK